MRSAIKRAIMAFETNQAYLEVSGLCKSYGQDEARVEVLKGIDVALAKGEVCVLLGPSDSGKSTFLNIVGGLESADAGRIGVNGVTITDLSPSDLVEYRIVKGSDLPITENIEVCQCLSPNPLPMDDLLKSLGLWEHRRKFPHEISGGQQQRCAIGRALVKNPGLLLCDEPTGALDYHTSKEILELMDQVNRDYGCTIVIVTHNDAIKHMAHRILRLRDGELVADELNEHILPARELTW